MGYVHKPIPQAVLDSMPPHIRAKAIAQERAHLVNVYERQGGQIEWWEKAIMILTIAGVIGGLVWPWMQR